MWGGRHGNEGRKGLKFITKMDEAAYEYFKN